MIDLNKKSRHWTAFLLAFGIGLIVFIPLALYNGGIFVYYGDYNSQQIPFYWHVHEAVRNGQWGWDWLTDLGANFIGSYSFYELFSPFFWLTVPFPVKMVPYMMAPLLALKTGCAALTSYFYLQRFTKNNWTTVAGSLLYAFSGFTTYNIFYNHFHEPIVFFPLLLIGLEDLLVDNKKGRLLFAVAINAIVNYWFFIMEAIFVVIYFFVRMTCWKLTWKQYLSKLVSVAVEAVLGLMIAMAVIVPSVLAIAGNPRTSFVDSLPNGYGALVYGYSQRPAAIFTSFFLPPEKVSSPNVWSKAEGKWSSIAAWLPMVSMSGVIGVWLSARKNWLKRLTIMLAVMAMIPGLNAVFIMLNNTFYTRWFYMFVLVMIAATVIAIENTSIDLRRGLKWTMIITMVIVLGVGLIPVWENGKLKSIGAMARPLEFWIWAIVAVAGLIVFAVLCKRLRGTDKMGRVLTIALAIFCAIYVPGYMWITKGLENKERDDWFLDHTVRLQEQMKLPAEGYYRTDVFKSGSNYHMIWGMPPLTTFNSIVPASIMEFYPAIGVERYVNSLPDEEVYGIRGFLSVQFVLRKTNAGEPPMEGYTLTQTLNDYNVYRNENYIPMGYMYDYYLTEDEFYQIPEDKRHLALVRAMILNEEQEKKYHLTLRHIKVPKKTTLIYKYYVEDCNARKEMTGQRFEITDTGFRSIVDSPKENLMFFSVPYDEGWSAKVNGVPTEIERVNVSFMAVPIGEGVSEIVFTYKTPGLKLGIAISLVGIGGAVIYLTLVIMQKKRKTVSEGVGGAADNVDAIKVAPKWPKLPPNYLDERQCVPHGFMENLPFIRDLVDQKFAELEARQKEQTPATMNDEDGESEQSRVDGVSSAVPTLESIEQLKRTHDALCFMKVDYGDTAVSADVSDAGASDVPNVPIEDSDSTYDSNA